MNAGEVPPVKPSNGIPSHDPESEAIPVEVRAVNLAGVERFAAELAERIRIPAAVRRIQRSGQAYVRFSRDGDSWAVERVTGDPYLRALLYEALTALKPASYPIQLLNAVTYPSVRIHISMSTASSLDQTVKAVSTSTDANKVYLAYVHKGVDERWKMIMPIDNEEGDDTVAPNLIGIASFLLDKATESNPHDDEDVKKIRLSPAFLRPLGK